MVVDFYQPPTHNVTDNDRFIEYGLSEILALTQLGHYKMSAQQSIAPEIQYSLVTEDDKDAILEMLKASFFKDEPLNTYVELGECKELEEYCAKNIGDNCSFKATNQKGEIIGVFLNGLLRKPDPDAPCEPAAPSCAHPRFKKILGLFDVLETRFNVFDLYPESDVMLDGKVLSVDSTYRGKGIANTLTQMSIDYMRLNRISEYHVLCTSHFSGQLMKKLGFESVFVFPFTDYLDTDGVQVLKPDLPHVQAEVMIKKIEY